MCGGVAWGIAAGGVALAFGVTVFAPGLVDRDSSKALPARPSGAIPPGIRPDAESKRKSMQGLNKVR